MVTVFLGIIAVFLGIIAVTDVLLFIKVIVDFVLALYFRKRDKKEREALEKEQAKDFLAKMGVYENETRGKNELQL